jgi:hypothetical protein
MPVGSAWPDQRANAYRVSFAAGGSVKCNLRFITNKPKSIFEASPAGLRARCRNRSLERRRRRWWRRRGGGGGGGGDGRVKAEEEEVAEEANEETAKGEEQRKDKLHQCSAQNEASKWGLVL